MREGKINPSSVAQRWRWVGERVNVLADATQAFGARPFQARQRAVASGTVNTGEQAGAGFAELHFVGADEPCQFSDANPP